MTNCGNIPYFVTVTKMADKNPADKSGLQALSSHAQGAEALVGRRPTSNGCDGPAPGGGSAFTVLWRAADTGFCACSMKTQYGHNGPMLKVLSFIKGGEGLALML